MLRPRVPTFAGVRGLGKDERAASAVEFALILPAMLAVWAGVAEVAHAVDDWRKVTLLARTVADLTSQGDVNNPMPPATMNDILAASTAVLRPFSAAGVKIVVSALAVDQGASTAYPKVCSSVSTSGNAYARGTGLATDLSIPPGLSNDGERYILAEVSMPYAPMIGQSAIRSIGNGGPITVKASIAWPTRGGVAYNSSYSEVILPNGAKCP